MIVCDTQAWIWWANRSPRLSAEALRAIETAETVGIPAIGIWEFAMLVRKERLSLAMDLEDWVTRLLARPSVQLLPMTPAIAIRAASFGDEVHRDPADRLILATAMELDTQLVTADRALRRTNLVRCIW